MKGRILLWASSLVLSGVAPAVPVESRAVPTTTMAHERGEVRLPRFSPDSRTLAYAVDLRRNDIWLSEIRAITIADGRRRTLLGWRETLGTAVYSAHAYALDWQDGDSLRTKVSDGDMAHTEFQLDRGRTGFVAETYVESDESGDPPADATLVAIVPDWKRPALDTAVARALRVEGHGMVLQKAYAGEDHHVWWLDTQANTARILVPQKPDERSELRGGFAFAGQLLFALRQGVAVNVYLLNAAGELIRIEGPGIASLPGGARFANSTSTSVGALELRRCGPEACWARLHLRAGDWTQVQVLRLDRHGKVEMVRGLDAIEDFDLSPDRRYLAATMREGEHTQLVLHRVLAF